jgi:Polyketide cyclase / dehydrase and lipid transport
VGELRVEAEGAVGAPADVAYRCLADYRHHHANFLPPQFRDYRVEEGGFGAGTVLSVTADVARGRSRGFRFRVTEPEPGRVLVESDTASSLATTFTVTPDGNGSRVRIATRWTGAGGVGGFFERLFAPRVMRRMYQDELSRLDRYAREQATGSAS